MLFKSSVLAAAAGLLSTVNAHATIRGVWVNGQDQGDGQNKYIRSPPNNDPVKSLTGSAISCNVNGGRVAPQFVTAAAGSTISTEWQHNTRGDDIIDPSHMGPVITYIAKYTTGDGSGAIWSKIDQSGLNGGTWAVKNVINNKGKYDFKLPSILAAGKYLVRQEIIALHEGNNIGGAQFYPSCIQFDVTGGGSATPNQNFNFVGGYSPTDPGIHFNLYNGATSYPIPGPTAIWSGSSSGGGSNNGGNTGGNNGGNTGGNNGGNTGGNTGGGSGTVPLYGQCGGSTYTGATACASGTCKASNEYYSQCVPA